MIYDIESDGKTIWVNGALRCLARFCSLSGEIFVDGKDHVISCEPDWELWKGLVKSYFNIQITDTLKLNENKD